ncbi:SpoU rRNA methylase family protein [Winogradskyella wandonensis]|uniref:SpoU rRNA methylase family protein n=1 Tax=Winogradskyella wandonensis TaxID=1442586 RepID=A0A4R1KVE8_9FLAO|nr:TrmH family RNA methyltransferase [Winogradskyella wandonensis]TCK69155.1 SpoU rRNA methylase family protein [Winogradskyella wandonensis]
MQLTHYNSEFKKQSFPITIVCDNVSNAPNIGSLFRIADAFGVEELIFCGEDIPLGKRMKRTSRSTEKYVTHRLENDIQEVLEHLKSNNYHLIALEITKNSKPLDKFKIPDKKPIALIIGNENHGISESVLNHANDVIHINMFGENSSMNVIQATAISLYEFTKQL